MADVSARSAFLIEGDTVRASWLLGREMPDVDAVTAAALSSSRSPSTPPARLVATWPEVRPHRRPLPRPPGGRVWRGGRRRPSPARLGVLAARALSSARQARPLGRPILVPARGDGSAEPPGLARKAPLRPLQRPVREHLGLQPRSSCSPSWPQAALPAGGRQRALGLARSAALAGGLVFALAPYRVGQSTGHLLGLIAFLLPAALLALERRRYVLAALALTAIPLSGTDSPRHGSGRSAPAYAWRACCDPTGGRPDSARVRRWRWRSSSNGSSSRPRSPAAAVRSRRSERYSAGFSDFVNRGVGSGIEEFVFLGWLTPLLALTGMWAIRRQRGLAVFLGVARHRAVPPRPRL